VGVGTTVVATVVCVAGGVTVSVALAVAVGVTTAVVGTPVATTTVTSVKTTLSASLLSTTVLLLSAMMVTRCGPSLVNVTFSVNCFSVLGARISVVVMLVLAPPGISMETWKTGAGASPSLATVT